MQERFFVRVNGVKLHYLEHGTGALTIVLLPGITSPAMLWRFVAERIAAFAHVITVDNRGRGLSDQSPDLTYTLDDYAADTAGLIDELGLSCPLVLGHSMGARIAVRLASRYADRVGALLLADPPVSGPGRSPYPQQLQQYLDVVDAASMGQPLPPSPIFTGEHLRLRAEWLPTCNRDAVIATHHGFQREDIFGDLPRICCATHLLYAELGGTISDADADEMIQLLPRGTKQKMIGIGHMMPWFDLDSFVSAVAAFAATIPATERELERP